MEPGNQMDRRVKNQRVHLCITGGDSRAVRVVLHEKMTVASVIGSALIFAGLIVSQKKTTPAVDVQES